jgi:hypothetical protein
MNRLDQQLEELKNKLEAYTKISTTSMQHFNSVKPSFEKILRSYKLQVEDYDNCMVDESIFDKTELTFRMFLGTNKLVLSKIKRINLQNKLRGLGLSLSVNTNRINISYRNEVK